VPVSRHSISFRYEVPVLGAQSSRTTANVDFRDMSIAIKLAVVQVIPLELAVSQEWAYPSIAYFRIEEVGPSRRSQAEADETIVITERSARNAVRKRKRERERERATRLHLLSLSAFHAVSFTVPSELTVSPRTRR